MHNQSLNLEISSSIDHQHGKIKSPFRRKKGNTTESMLLLTLYELQSKRGFTLYAIRKHIEETNNITITSKRHNQIKNKLKEMLEIGSLIKINGRGLIGHMRINKIDYDLMKKHAKSKQPKSNKNTIVTPEDATIPAEESNFIRAPLKKIAPQHRSKLILQKFTPHNSTMIQSTPLSHKR